MYDGPEAKYTNKILPYLTLMSYVTDPVVVQLTLGVVLLATGVLRFAPDVV